VLPDLHPKMSQKTRDEILAQLLEQLKMIWLTALQPCGRRLEAMMPRWVAAYEADQKPLESEVRERLLEARHATLEHFLII